MTSPQADVYAAEQQAAVAAAIAAAAVTAGLAGYQLANFTVFMRFLRAIWPAVLLGRQRAAWSSRNFFDRERARVTGLPQLDVPLLPDYEFDWFVNDMKPAYKMAVKQIRQAREVEKTGRPAPAPRIESTVRVAVAKVVADAGREQMIGALQADADRAMNLRDTKKELKRIRAVDLDSQAPGVIGWARAATGDETCAFCMMLVSRGSQIMYSSSQKAGASRELSEEEVVALFGSGAEIPMDDWHTGCDCTVIPIYDVDDWPGKAAAEDALEMWKAAGEDFVYDEDKKYRFGYQQKDLSWKFKSAKVTEGAARYRETLNNLRFTLEGRDPKERRQVTKELRDEIGAIKLLEKELNRR